MTDYKDTIPASAPSWLQGRVGGAILGGVGSNFDLLLTAAKDAVKQRFVELAADDSLPFLGAAANIQRYPSDTTTGFKERIRAAWETWTLAGVESTITSELQRYLSTITWLIIENRDWSPDLPPDSNSAWWSRFWLFATGTPWSNDGTWSSAGTWDDDGTWDSTASLAEIATIRSILKKWKPAHTINKNIVVALNNNVDFYGPFGTWNNGTWDSDGAIAAW